VGAAPSEDKGGEPSDPIAEIAEFDQKLVSLTADSEPGRKRGPKDHDVPGGKGKKGLKE